MENVFCLPGVPSILKSMLGGLKNYIVGGEPILTQTISLRTIESKIAKSLTNIQDNNKDVEIGSYPFFQAGKLGVSIVIRSESQNKIEIYEKNEEKKNLSSSIKNDTVNQIKNVSQEKKVKFEIDKEIKANKKILIDSF